MKLYELKVVLSYLIMCDALKSKKKKKVNSCSEIAL